MRTRRITRAEAGEHLEHVRRLRIRLLGDRVLQARALQVAGDLRWANSLGPEYIALTQLQANALVTTDSKLAIAARRFVSVAPLMDLM